MGRMKRHLISRRDFLKAAGVGAVAAGAGFDIFIPRRSRAAGKTLKILQWNHFVPGYDRWFDAHARSWGEQHDTDVTVDHV
ncbi:MAG: twin-arginine translocation signal domain-containing protein, partial [Deltaproteobacteria bacterium]